MTPLEQQQKYLKLVRVGSGYLGLRTTGKEFSQCWFQDDPQALTLINQYSATHDVWGSMAEFPDRTKSRHADNAGKLCSLWLDVDAHEGSKYANPKKAEDAITQFVADTGLPPPNLIHLTGHGVQALWPLDKSLSRDEWQPIADKLQLLADAHKLGADPITADAARILRVPGTLNFRNPDAPVRTELVVVRDGYNSLDEFEVALNAAVEKLPPEVRQSRPSKANPKFEDPETPENVAIVKDMLEKIDPDPGQSGTRPKWRNIIWAVAATGYTEAYDIARAWSERGDLWDEDDFNGVWDSFDPERGIGFGTLVHHARDASYNGPLPGPGDNIPAEPVPSLSGRLMTRRASEIQPEPIDWLVEGSIPLGMLMVIGGQPGLGKSQIALKLAAAITTGKGLPDDKI